MHNSFKNLKRCPDVLILSFTEPDLQTTANTSGLADYEIDKEINTTMFVQENGGIYDLVTMCSVEPNALGISNQIVYTKKGNQWLKIDLYASNDLDTRYLR